MSIKTALAVLERNDLIMRKRQGIGLPNRIYVKIPQEVSVQTDRNLSMKQTENCLTDGQKTILQKDGKVSSSNKEKNNIKKVKKESKEERIAYGTYENVFLTVEELKALQSEIPYVQKYIEKLSNYMESSGKQYSNHAATIRSWALRDTPVFIKRNYECEEEESL